MSEEELKNVIREVHKAAAAQDMEKMRSFYSDDATIVNPEGTFKGKAEIRRYWTWLYQQLSEVLTIEKEIIIQGNKAVHEYMYESTSLKGIKGSVPGVSMLQFENNKIKEVRSYLDRLMIAKQGATGLIGPRLVNTIVNRMEKGLH